MDLYAKKIMGFLQANPGLDLETADIAFHLKLDEHFVQNYMSQLLRQGMVTSRKNEYGRVYWYHYNLEPEIEVMELPPAPKTEVSAKKGKEDDGFEEFLENQEKKLPVLKVMFVVVLTAALGALGYLGLESVNGKINRVADSMKNIIEKIVDKTEYDQYKKESSSRMIKLENEIRTLGNLVDSLKTVLTNHEMQHKSEPTVKVSRTGKRRK